MCHIIPVHPPTMSLLFCLSCVALYIYHLEVFFFNGVCVLRLLDFDRDQSRNHSGMDDALFCVECVVVGRA